MATAVIVIIIIPIIKMTTNNKQTRALSYEHWDGPNPSQKGHPNFLSKLAMFSSPLTSVIPHRPTHSSFPLIISFSCHFPFPISYQHTHPYKPAMARRPHLLNYLIGQSPFQLFSYKPHKTTRYEVSRYCTSSCHHTLIISPWRMMLVVVMLIKTMIATTLNTFIITNSLIMTLTVKVWKSQNNTNNKTLAN